MNISDEAPPLPCTPVTWRDLYHSNFSFSVCSTKQLVSKSWVISPKGLLRITMLFLDVSHLCR